MAAEVIKNVVDNIGVQVFELFGEVRVVIDEVKYLVANELVVRLLIFYLCRLDESPLQGLIPLLKHLLAVLQKFALPFFQRTYLLFKSLGVRFVVFLASLLFLLLGQSIAVTFRLGFFTFDQPVPLGLSTYEQGMLKLMDLFVVILELDEGVEVELPQKRAIVAVAKILRQQMGAELVGLMDDEGPFAGGPADEFVVLWVVEDLSQFEDEGGGLESPLRLFWLHYKQHIRILLKYCSFNGYQATAILMLLGNLDHSYSACLHSSLSHLSCSPWPSSSKLLYSNELSPFIPKSGSGCRVWYFQGGSSPNSSCLRRMWRLREESEVQNRAHLGHSNLSQASSMVLLFPFLAAGCLPCSA